jgi:His/Glu/Gln/Arg/opine family amino acid ABC transporter permease subunit
VDISVIVDNFDALMQATGVTVLLTVVILVVSTVLAFPLALVRQSKSRWAHVIAAYSWIARSVPAIVLLFFVYFGLPSAGIFLPALGVAIVVLSLQQVGYVSEVVRGGILSIDPRQRDAVMALGIPKVRAWSRILLPQALRAMVPPYFSNSIHILQATAIAEVITVVELTAETNKLIGLTYQAVVLLLFCGMVYLILASVLVGLQALAERALALPGTRPRLRWRSVMPRLTSPAIPTGGAR